MTTTLKTSVLESIMRPQVDYAIRVALHHFARRHDGRGSRPARQWIDEARQLCEASGYRHPSMSL